MHFNRIYTNLNKHVSSNMIMFSSKRKKGIVPQFEYQQQLELLTKALGYLSDDVHDFLSERLIEISTGEMNAVTKTHKDLDIMKKERVYATIHLSWHIWDYYDDEEIIRIMLNEVASIYLDHASDVPPEEKAKQEKDADALVEEWGFVKRDIEECRRKKAVVQEKKKKNKVKFFDQEIELVDSLVITKE
jgi:hypothetical protein